MAATKASDGSALSAATKVAKASKGNGPIVAAVGVARISKDNGLVVAT